MATSVPTEVVVAGMQGFEDAYNADNTAFCGACYTDKCHVTVNGGTEAGGFGPFTTPAEVAAFLNTLRNELGGTNIKFTVTNVDALKHDDTWTADNGTGACAAEWVQVDGNWKIEKDAISFTPKAPSDFVADENGLPVRNRVYESHHFDGPVWDELKMRDDDVVIATAYKSGTTWVQNIVGLLIHGGEEPEMSVADQSLWADLRVPPREVKHQIFDGIKSRRFIKTHLPINAIKFDPKVKYIVVGRAGLDVFMSLMNHYEKGNDMWYGALNDTPGLVGPPIPRFADLGDIHEKFSKWLNLGWDTLPWEKDGWPFWSVFYHYDSWYKFCNLPNILFVHFDDLKSQPDKEVTRIAEFLGTPLTDDVLAKVLHKSSFDFMKANADKVAPLGGSIFTGGGASFINKGTNSRWKGVLTDEEVAAYHKIAKDRLSPDAYAWLHKDTAQ